MAARVKRRPVFPKYECVANALKNIIDKLESADHFTIDLEDKKDRQVLGALHLIRLIVAGVVTERIPFRRYPLEMERVIRRVGKCMGLSWDFLPWIHTQLGYLEKAKRQGRYESKAHMLLFLIKVRGGVLELSRVEKRGE